MFVKALTTGPSRSIQTREFSLGYTGVTVISKGTEASTRYGTLVKHFEECHKTYDFSFSDLGTQCL